MSDPDSVQKALPQQSEGFKGLRLTAGHRPSNLGTMLALCWAYVGPMLAHVEPSWELCWRPCLGHLCWNDLKMPIVPPRAPPGAQSQVKTEVLQHRQDEILCRRRARNTVKKKRCLFYTASKKHRKLEVLQSLGESRRGWFGSGSRRIRGARSWPWHCRTAVLSSPKEKGAAAPAADQPPLLSKTTAFYGVFCYSHFSTLVA